MTLESQRLKSEIGSRDDLLQRIDTETVLVEEVHTLLHNALHPSRLC